jgi:hypothetical protein
MDLKILITFLLYTFACGGENYCTSAEAVNFDVQAFTCVV